MAAAMSVLALFAAFAFDMSRLRSAKGELQAAADAAAMNGANGLADGTYLAKAQAAAADNYCDGTSVSIAAANVTVGNWTSATFTANGLAAQRDPRDRLSNDGRRQPGELLRRLDGRQDRGERAGDGDRRLG